MKKHTNTPAIDGLVSSDYVIEYENICFPAEHITHLKFGIYKAPNKGREYWLKIFVVSREEIHFSFFEDMDANAKGKRDYLKQVIIDSMRAVRRKHLTKKLG